MKFNLHFHSLPSHLANRFPGGTVFLSLDVPHPSHAPWVRARCRLGKLLSMYQVPEPSLSVTFANHTHISSTSLSPTSCQFFRSDTLLNFFKLLDPNHQLGHQQSLRHFLVAPSSGRCKRSLVVPDTSKPFAKSRPRVISATEKTLTSSFLLEPRGHNLLSLFSRLP